MTIALEPEVTVALYEGVGTPEDILDCAQAMFNTTQYAKLWGATPEVTDRDRYDARCAARGDLTAQDIQAPGVVVHLRTLLDRYDVAVVEQMVQIRRFVTNRLLDEAAPGKKGAIRALELLGKISGVDLFTERSEVTVRHTTSADLEAKVREKLDRLATIRSAGAVEDIPFMPVQAPLVEGAPLPSLPVPSDVPSLIVSARRLFDAVP